MFFATIRFEFRKEISQLLLLHAMFNNIVRESKLYRINDILLEILNFTYLCCFIFSITIRFDSSSELVRKLASCWYFCYVHNIVRESKFYRINITIFCNFKPISYASSLFYILCNNSIRVQKGN